MTIYDGTWIMLCIGPGPGPKNVLAQRVEDGRKCVFAYATWKHRITKAGNRKSPDDVYLSDIHRQKPGGSQMDLQVAILQVAVRTTSNGRQIFDVSCGDGKTRAVWEAPLANAINAFAGSGQQITIRVKVSQKGQYTNESITAFAPPGQALPPDAQGGGNGTSNGGFRRGGGGMSPEDKTRIAKMGAQGSASTLVAALFTGAGPEAYDEAVGLLDMLTKKLYKEARSHEKSDTQQQDGTTVLVPGATVGDAAATTPQAIAASIPGVQVGAQVLQPGGAADAAAGADVVAQQAAESGDGVDWN